MAKKVSLVLLNLVLLVACQDHDKQDEYPFQVGLDTEGQFQLFWRVEHKSNAFEPRQTWLHFQLCMLQTERSQTHRGLFGLAFSSREDASIADVLLVTETAPQEWSLFEAYSDESGTLKLRHKNRKASANEPSLVRVVTRGIRNASTDKWQEFLCAEITRTALSCRQPFGYTIDTGTTRVYGFSAPRRRWRWTEGLHLRDLQPVMNRVQLIKHVRPANDLSVKQGVHTFEMTVDRVHVPSDNHTTYWCKTTRLPRFQQKMHIIRYEPIITKKSVGVVHHMEVFRCKGPPGRLYDAACNSETKPMGLTHCREVLGAWAMGANGIDMPAEAGIPIDLNESFVVIEVHYNNPELKRGIIDSSGIRFYVTKRLRAFDAGVMELGLNYSPGNAIPPRQKHFTMTGYCDSSCTRIALPREGIRVFASQLHTHQTGIQVTTYHLDANGKALAPLNQDKNYSPHFQEIRPIETRLVKPGDTLITQCVHSTEAVNHTVVGGVAISDEMCLNYIFYYPKSPLELCKSEVAPRELDQFLAGLQVDLNVASRAEQFDQIDWRNPQNARSLASFYRQATIEMSCNSSAGARMLQSEIYVKPSPLGEEQPSVVVQTMIDSCLLNMLEEDTKR